MRRKRRDDKHEAAQLTERIRVIAARVWQGNQARMAQELDVSRPVINRVMNGKQRPTGKLLASLLRRHPDVNLQWLLGGKGEPFVEPGVAAGGGRMRPVVDVLLPGPPQEHLALLSGLGYPIAVEFHSTTSYWYRVPAAAPVVASDEKIDGGDKLLIESGAKFTRRLDAVLGRLCTFRVKAGRRQRVALGKVAAISQVYFEAYERFAVSFFGQPPAEAWLLVADTAADLKAARTGVSGLCLEMADVMGVCTILERALTKQLDQDPSGGTTD